MYDEAFAGLEGVVTTRFRKFASQAVADWGSRNFKLFFPHMEP